MKHLLLAVCLVTTAMSCGRRESKLTEKAKRSQQGMEQEQKRADAAEGALAASRKELDVRSETLTAQMEEIERTRAQMSTLRTQLDALTASGTGGNDSEIQTLRGALAQKDVELAKQTAALTEQEKITSSTRAELAKDRAQIQDLTRIIGVVTKPMKGLWSILLPGAASADGPCRLFLQVDGLQFQKTIICGRASTPATLRASYEAGLFSDLELHDIDVSAVDFHRRMSTKSVLSSCNSNGFMGATTSVAWSAAAATFMAVSTGEGEVDGLSQGQSGIGTRDCAQILERPNRSGLAIAVLACRLFTRNAGDLATWDQVGCFTRQANASLLWERKDPTAVP